jgi:hypothetical protein
MKTSKKIIFFIFTISVIAGIWIFNGNESSSVPITNENIQAADSEHLSKALNNQILLSEESALEKSDEKANTTSNENKTIISFIDNLNQILMDHPHSDEREALIQSLLKSILHTALESKTAEKELIEIFLSDPMSEISRYLLPVFAEIKTPQVEKIAQDLAQSNSDDYKLVGLELLGDLDMKSKKTFNIVTGIIGQADNDKPEILMGAINAMPKVDLSDYEASNAKS